MQGFPFRLERWPTQQALIEALAGHLEQHLRQRLMATIPGRPLGLATGRTMEPLYAALVQRLQAWPRQDLEVLRRGWSSFNLDEYLGLQPDDPRCYRSFMARHLGHPLQLPESTMQLPDSMATDVEAMALSYRRALEAQGGIGLQLLGLGSNGHVGFNEPPCGAELSCRAVSLSKATRTQNAVMFGGDAANVPLQAITLGLREILAADEIHLVVTGSAKAGILRRLLSCSQPDNQLPASWLLCHPQVWLWADTEALPRL